MPGRTRPSLTQQTTRVPFLNIEVYSGSLATAQAAETMRNLIRQVPKTRPAHRIGA